MSVCKYGEFCSDHWPCDYHKREMVAELEAKERSARHSFHTETLDERDERIAREAQDRISRRQQVREMGEVSPGTAIGAFLGLLGGAVIGAIADSPSREEKAGIDGKQLRRSIRSKKK